MTVKYTPEGYHSVTPYLIVKDAAAAIEFYLKAFGASELMRFVAPDGKMGHAEIKIGNSPVMLADEYPDMGFRSPQTLGGAGMSILVYVENVDNVYDQAISAGAKLLRPVEDQFYGDRSGTLEDPFGHVWILSTHIEDLTPEEINERAQASFEELGNA